MYASKIKSGRLSAKKWSSPENLSSFPRPWRATSPLRNATGPDRTPIASSSMDRVDLSIGSKVFLSKIFTGITGNGLIFSGLADVLPPPRNQPIMLCADQQSYDCL